MPLRSSIENYLIGVINNILVFVVSYVETYWKVFRKPKLNLPELIAGENTNHAGMRPSVFLITNMVVVFSLEAGLGLSLPKIPIELPGIIGLCVGYLKYIAGIIIFASYLLLLLYRKEFPLGLLKMFSVIGYPSVVYLPVSIIGAGLENSYGNLILEIYSSIGNREFTVWHFSILEFAVFMLFYIVCVVWWLYLVYISVGVVWPVQSKCRRRTAVPIAYTCYVSTKIALTIMVGIIVSWGFIVGVFEWQFLKLELKESVFKCGSLWKLSYPLSINEEMTEYPRYVATLVVTACQPIVFPLTDIDSARINQVIAAIADKKYEAATKMLYNLAGDYEENNHEGHEFIRTQMKTNLAQANKLRNSPGYKELDKDDNIMFQWSSAVISIFP